MLYKDIDILLSDKVFKTLCKAREAYVKRRDTMELNEAYKAARKAVKREFEDYKNRLI